MREAWSISPGFGQKLTFIGHQLQRMLQHCNIGAGFMRIFAQVATPLASAGDPLKQPQHMAGNMAQIGALAELALNIGYMARTTATGSASAPATPKISRSTEARMPGF